MKSIYILNTCNAWQENASMCKVSVTTSPRKVVAAVKKLVKDDAIEVKDKEKYKQWLHDMYWLLSTREETKINDICNYVYLEVWKD